MDKNKLVKIISVTTGMILIGVIIYYVVEKDWNEVGFYSFLFLGIWIMPAILKNINKKK
jgi:hypothetical protein|tara:strand:- start:3 stop:179 length:177 start_codon:yes stop_codon:yes gene_type:complete